MLPCSFSYIAAYIIHKCRRQSGDWGPCQQKKWDENKEKDFFASGLSVRTIRSFVSKSDSAVKSSSVSSDIIERTRGKGRARGMSLPRDVSGDKLPPCKLWKWNFQTECDRPREGRCESDSRVPLARRSLLEQMAGTFFVIYSYSSASLVFFCSLLDSPSLSFRSTFSFLPSLQP